MSEETSIEQAGGCAAGLTGTISAWNADTEANLCKALNWVGQYVEHEAGCLLGHIKAAVLAEDGRGVTLNLTSMDTGIEHHGLLEPQEKVKFSFMAAVLDVDEHELEHMMFHAIDDAGLDYKLDEDAGCKCGCHDHDHEHHHHHHDGEECHCHDHEHGHEHHHDEECHCHDHEHEHHHHHHDGEECHCHDHEEGASEVHHYYHYVHEYHYYYHMDGIDEAHREYLAHAHHHHHHDDECHCHEHEHEHHHDGECHCHDGN